MPDDSAKRSGEIRLRGGLSDAEGRDLWREVTARLEGGETAIVLNFEAVDRIDSFAGAWLARIYREVRERGAEMRFAGEKGTVGEFLNLIRPSFARPEKGPPPRPGFFEAVGAAVLRGLAEARDAVNLLVEAIYWSFLGPVEGKGLRWGSLLDEMHEIGVRAIGIVALCNFLLGLIIAMMSSAQLRTFGAEIFVADLVGIAFARELAVIMTAVVLSARSGSAIAAELATMTVQEEIDALRGMGLNTARFVVAPKLWAILIAQPCLTMIGMLAGTLGGFLMGVLYLGFPAQRWIDHTVSAVKMGDILQGFSKSFFFALIIVLVGCHNGLRVRGGARGVGLSTTRAVVMDIFLIIIVDMIFTLVFYMM